MGDWDDDLEHARAAWSRWCRALERTGLDALDRTITHDEIDLAEGLRHLTRVARITLRTQVENCDSAHPYFHRSLGPTLKMGGDNPSGLYLSAPINGTDTYRIRGTRGSAVWVSFLAQRRHDCLAQGLSVFGDAIYAPELHVEPDGTFTVVLSPDERPGNWIQTDEYSASIIIRQFFGSVDDVRPMDITIENLSRGDEPKQPLTLAESAARLDRSAGAFQLLVPAMQSEMIAKGATPNTFATDIGDPTSNFGGVPGGNAVTCRWRLEPHEALLVQVTPPDGCPYWDVQVGNGWYESWDYRHFFSGFTAPQAATHDDGSVTLVVSQRDPGTVNWLEAAHHREGHLAIRWQLTHGVLPIPVCRVVDVDRVGAETGLPVVTPDERRVQRRAQRAAVERRFRP